MLDWFGPSYIHLVELSCLYCIYFLDSQNALTKLPHSGKHVISRPIKCQHPQFCSWDPFSMFQICWHSCRLGVYMLLCCFPECVSLTHSGKRAVSRPIECQYPRFCSWDPFSMFQICWHSCRLGVNMLLCCFPECVSLTHSGKRAVSRPIECQYPRFCSWDPFSMFQICWHSCRLGVNMLLCCFPECVSLTHSGKRVVSRPIECQYPRLCSWDPFSMFQICWHSCRLGVNMLLCCFPECVSLTHSGKRAVSRPIECQYPRFCSWDPFSMFQICWHSCRLGVNMLLCCFPECVSLTHSGKRVVSRPIECQYPRLCSWDPFSMFQICWHSCRLGVNMFLCCFPECVSLLY